MYIAALIGSITAFVCACVPLFGIPFTLIFSIIGIIFSLIVLRNNKEKDRKDASIISLVISIAAIIICIVVNILSSNYINKVIKEIYNIDNIDYKNYYNEKFGNYETYNIENIVNIGDKFTIKVNNLTEDEEYYYIDTTLKALRDDVSINIYDFGIYYLSLDEFEYPKYVKENNIISIVLNNAQERNVLLKIEKKEDNRSDKFLIYMDNENGVKIGI